MRTEGEMAHTLAALRDLSGVDVSPAQGWHGEELAAWLEQAEDALFESEHSELRAQRSENHSLPADDGGFYFLSGGQDEL
jgi:hypothetical protein